MLLTCYHGTSLENWEKIKNTGEFHPSANGWFGTGVYWYLDSYEMAVFWARKKFNYRKRIILQYRLDVDEEHILDLRDPYGDDCRLFHNRRNMMLKLMETLTFYSPDTGRKIDNTVLNILSRRFVMKAAIANSFTYDNNKGKRIQSISRIPNGTEICIYQPDLIAISEVKELWIM